jgi:integrase
MFSPDPDGRRPLDLTTASRRYARLAKRLNIDTSLKNMRHYNATELIRANYQLKTVAARLGHGGGGTTTLKVYTATHSEADQRSAGPMTPRMPPRPTGDNAISRQQPPAAPSSTDVGLQPYQRIVADLRGAIDSGILAPGDRLPPEIATAHRYEVSTSTTRRAVALLAAGGLVSPARGKRPTLVLGSTSETRSSSGAVVDLRPQI